MKKNPKDKHNQKGKECHSLKDIIPSSYEHIQESIGINPPETTLKVYNPENIPNPLFEEFPNDETDIETLQKSLLENPEEIFKDPAEESIYIPKSLYKDYLNEEIKWTRPIHYIVENKLDNDIKIHFPKKNTYAFREKVHEKFREEERRKRMEQEGLLEPKSDKSDSDEKNDANAIYKDYFNYLKTPPNITVVKFFQREETDEEYETRIKREQDEIDKYNLEKKKNKNLQPTITEVNREKLKISEASPSRINMKDTYPIYCKWLASILEIIRERNINDVNNNYSIFQRIYPQQNGVPIYNSKGIYWVKLYHFGKLRKIIIDDRMPTDKYDKFFLPRCENLEEIWPALITKAIFKLYSYKIVSNTFKECGDFEVFYALTGYIPEFVDLIKENDLFKMFEVVDKNVNDKFNVDDNNVIEENKSESKSNFSGTGQNFHKLSVNNNNEENIIKEEEEEDPKLIFLQKTLSDENYISKNCYIFCYRNEKEEKKSKEEEEEEEELQPQKLYNPAKRKAFNRMNSMKATKKNEVTISAKKGRRVSIKMDKIEENEHNISIDSPKSQRKRNSIRIKPLNSNDNNNIDNKKNANVKKTDDENIYVKSASKKKIQFNVQTPQEKGNEIYRNNIFFGVLYDIVEFFNNHCFNMSRLLPIDFSDLRAMIKNFNSNNVFKQLSREEKKVYIHELREIKKKQREEKIKRIESLKANGKKYYSIKIHNSSVLEPNFFTEHTNEEIEMTKRCLNNNWKFPPLDYLEHVYETKHINNEKNENEEEEEENLNEHKKKKHYTWSKEVYMHLIGNNLEQYKEPKEALIRKEGSWIEPNDFFDCFDSFIMLYNPKIYQTNFYWDNLWYNINDILNVNVQNKVLHLIPNENTQKSYMIINFSVNSDDKFKLRDIAYAIHFLLLKKDEKIEEGKLITLNSFFGSKHVDQLNIKEDYFLIFMGGLFPNGFYMKFFTDFVIEPIKYSDFLVEFKGFNRQVYNIEQTNLKKGDFYVLLRVSVKLETKTKLFIINNSSKDYYFKEYIEIFVCESGNNNIKKKLFFENIFELEAKEYFIVITCIPPYNVEADNYEIEILTLPEDDRLDVSQTNTAVPGEINKLQANLEQIEHISPYDINQKYKINKHFILFKEYIFVGELVYATLNIKIQKYEKNESDELEEVEFMNPIRLKLVLYNKEDNIIYETDFYNNITLHNLILEGNLSIENTKSNKKNEQSEIQINKPYKLYCYIDKTELPNYLENPENLNLLSWNIRVFSSNTLGFCEDTYKEDNERKVIEAWESEEPGRSELAKNSRKRFILSQRNFNELNDEEKKFLKTQRIRKKENKNEESKELNNPKKVNKNDKNKNIKGKQNIEEYKEEVKKENTVLNFNKKIKSSNYHSSLYIKNFLNYTFNDRLITYDHSYNPEQKQLNTESTTFEKEEKITQFFEQSERLLTESEEDYELAKTTYLNTNKTLYDNILNHRKKNEKKKEEILKGRNTVKQLLLLKAEAEQKLKELIELFNDNDNDNTDKKNKKDNKFDFNSAFEIYNDAIKTGLKSKLIEQVFLLFSKKKEEMIEEELKKNKGKEKEIIPKIFEDIRKNKWKISDSLIDKLDSFQ